MIIVDPPSGWRYGFPAPWPKDETLEDVLRRHNYPEEDFPLALKYSRYWESKEDLGL